eukprot:5037463-Pyramimonas_sp.AAC.1
MKPPSGPLALVGHPVSVSFQGRCQGSYGGVSILAREFLGFHGIPDGPCVAPHRVAAAVVQ